MANGNGAVAILLLHHQLCHWLAYDVAPSQDDALLAAGGNLVALEQFKDAFRCGANVARKPDSHSPDIDGMETIYILSVVDGLYDLLLADVLGQGKLDDEAVNIRVAIQSRHTGQKFLLGDIVFEAKQSALEATSLASQDLVADVCLASSVVPDKNGCQVRTLAALRHDFLHLCLYLSLYGGSCLFAVN